MHAPQTHPSPTVVQSTIVSLGITCMFRNTLQLLDVYGQRVLRRRHIWIHANYSRLCRGLYTTDVKHYETHCGWRPSPMRKETCCYRETSAGDTNSRKLSAFPFFLSCATVFCRNAKECRLDGAAQAFALCGTTEAAGSQASASDNVLSPSKSDRARSLNL